MNGGNRPQRAGALQKRRDSVSVQRNPALRAASLKRDSVSGCEAESVRLREWCAQGMRLSVRSPLHPQAPHSPLRSLSPQPQPLPSCPDLDTQQARSTVRKCVKYCPKCQFKDNFKFIIDNLFLI